MDGENFCGRTKVSLTQGSRPPSPVSTDVSPAPVATVPCEATEWNEGWHLRFGLVELDPQTQVRTPRASARLYSEIIRKNKNGFGG
ncbi:MAG TPA: family 1 glycosylhydrolase [Alphaproteobacteria bacterium]|nr:family 1 glycosylhydrolase [Alphaproteobacteria bacterium]